MTYKVLRYAAWCLAVLWCLLAMPFWFYVMIQTLMIPTGGLFGMPPGAIMFMLLFECLMYACWCAAGLICAAGAERMVVVTYELWVTPAYSPEALDD
jgi:hypothetical protein